MNQMITLPKQVTKALELLKENGFEAYAVGGCVRDSLLGRKPKDWDITTNALPGQSAQCFQQFCVHETGIRYGTVTVVIDRLPIEITTYRRDGAYTDSRRPDSVAFTASLREDLARRDFTVNAMAYRPDCGVLDYFGGRADLEAGLVRCVGLPDVRFGEDALRILRALRFASRLGFDIEERTAQSIHKNCNLLRRIAPERVGTEFCALMEGESAPQVLENYSDVIAEFVPEIKPMIGFEQHNQFHHLDVWRHSLTALYYTPPQLELRLAVLFHDAAKPACYTQDEAGVGHFSGHPEKSAHLARERLNALRLDKKTIRAVETLIRYHDDEIAPAVPDVKHWLAQLGPHRMHQLLEVKQADCLARNPVLVARGLNELEQIKKTMRQVLESGECYRKDALEIDGSDLLELGFAEGRQIGAVLDQLLEAVIGGQIANRREVLLDCARRIRKEI